MTDQVNEAVAWPRGVLNRDRTLEVLTQHNAWRRGAEGEQTDPRILGLALDAAIAAISGGYAHPSRGVVDDEDRFEQYVATLIATNPDVRKLGERLADWLDDDRFNTINPILLGIAQRLAALPAVPEGYVLVRRDSIERAAQMAEVFDDGSDGADAETAARVAHDLRGWLIASTPAHDQPEGEG